MNVLLYCNEAESPPLALAAVEKAIEEGKISESIITENYEKMLRVKKSKLVNPDPIPFEEIARLIGHPNHLKIVKAITTGEIPEDLAT